MKYSAAVENIWRPTPSSVEGSLPPEAVVREIVRCATLAPSSHNTQCWKFLVGQSTITILPDLERRCPVVDPDDHHLYVSLGCAVENAVIAALAHGLEANVDSTFPANGIQMKLKPCPPEVTPYFEAIPHRQVTRTEYNGEPLLQMELDQLLRAAVGDGSNGVQVVFLTEPQDLEMVGNFIVGANAAQVENKDFRQELESWIRFGENECVDAGDGLSSPTTGNPFVPRFIGKHIFRATLRAGPENEKILRQINSSAGFAVFVSEKDDAAHWVEAGRAYQRFALEATNMGVRNAMLNQPVEEKEIRPEFAKALKIEGRPDLVVRFGKGGPELPHSLRRPVESVLEYKN